MARAPKLTIEEQMLAEMRVQTRYLELAATVAYAQFLQAAPHGQHAQELDSIRAYLQHELVPEPYRE